MKQLTLYLVAMSLLFSCNTKPPQYQSFEEYPTAPNANLWVNYQPEATMFTLWSPVAEAVNLHLYKEGTGGTAFETHALNQQDHGLWDLTVEQDLKGLYYTYQVKVNGHWLEETPGIYAYAVGVNGQRAQVVDLASTNPSGWDQDQGPHLNSPNDAVIYELHIRDFTIQPEANSSYPGKFLGFTETGTTGPDGVATGIDHLKELGVTHVHILPAFDFWGIDESQLEIPQYNWGYNPQNYNVPEGSYATNPYDGAVRIKEFKQLVKTLHDNNIGVILDVVYNHTVPFELSNFEREVPGYYYRQREDGSPSNASACGNETASEREMMQKFMIESVNFWQREYHVDGFRFDLMAIHDQVTMNHIANMVKKHNSSALVYGEGWAAGESPYDPTKRAYKILTNRMPQVSAFSDEIRDGLKGLWDHPEGAGFVSGAGGLEESVKMGVVGCVAHPQVDNSKVNTSQEAWANNPWQSIVYVSCHDNHTLYDKLKLSRPDASEEDLIKMDKLANAVVLTSQGIPFIHAGAEMLRTKQGVENSYVSPDSINELNWYRKAQYPEVVAYYKNLIAFRKAIRFL